MGFFDEVNLTKKSEQNSINLSKKGDSHSIDLSKSSNELSFNLNWNKKVTAKDSQNMFNKFAGNFVKESELDLDLGCLYRLKDGSKGVVQALGNSFGSLNKAPFIFLDKDDRSGKNADGETMKFLKPEEIDLVVVYAFIYKGAINWQNAKGIVTIKQPNKPDIIIKLEDESNQTMCGIAVLKNSGSKLVVEKLEKYYQGHKFLDEDFGFGFNWVAGSK
jgi:tellurite resistance protein TerA